MMTGGKVIPSLGVGVIATFTASGSTSATVSMARMRDGDLMLFFGCSETGTVITTPNGWTSYLPYIISGTFVGASFHKVVDGTGDETSVTFGGTGLTESTALGVVIRDYEVTGYSATYWTRSAAVNTTAPNPLSVNNVTTDDIILLVLTADSVDNTATPPAGYTLIASVQTGTSPDSSYCGIAFATGLSGTVDPGAWALNELASCNTHTIRLTPV